MFKFIKFNKKKLFYKLTFLQDQSNYKNILQNLHIYIFTRLKSFKKRISTKLHISFFDIITLGTEYKKIPGPALWFKF